MLATQVRQKDGVFYFAAYPVEDLLAKVRFISRYYGEGEELAPEPTTGSDEIAEFIGHIEHSDKAFQRQLGRAKVAALKNFYETAASQPPIPGSVLLFTNERLHFDPVQGFESVGHLQEPKGKYLVIDGQHRLAALHFYRDDRPGEARTISVPCVIFDGRSEDFATEMFVIINSTPTRINKSHLIDLYERVSWAAPEKKFAAKVVEKLYSAGDSPLRYRINRLGGRAQRQKWILQAELFNELNRWITADWKGIERRGADDKEVDRFYRVVRDFLKAAETIWGETWGHNSYMITSSVTLKALLRVCADLAPRDATPENGRIDRWTKRLTPWAELKRMFRAEGFYERFPAKGQVERVSRIHRELLRAAGIEPYVRSQPKRKPTDR